MHGTERPPSSVLEGHGYAGQHSPTYLLYTSITRVPGAFYCISGVIMGASLMWPQSKQVHTDLYTIP
jgi:hypothetical protein